MEQIKEVQPEPAGKQSKGDPSALEYLPWMPLLGIPISSLAGKQQKDLAKLESMQREKEIQKKQKLLEDRKAAEKLQALAIDEKRKAAERKALDDKFARRSIGGIQATIEEVDALLGDGK